MARPIHRFKKGEVHNPLGAGAHNPLHRQVRKLTKQELAEVASVIIKSDLKGLTEIKENANHPAPTKRPSVLQVWIASAAIKGINTGNFTTLNQILDRVIGKVKDEVEVSGPGGTSIAVSRVTPEEREAEIKRLLEIRRAADSE